MFASPRVRSALPVVLAAGFCLLEFYLYPKFPDGGISFRRHNYSGFFLAGVPDKSIFLNMPLFDALLSSAIDLGMNPGLFFMGVLLGIYTLVFCAGCLLGGYWAGIVSLLASGGLEAVATFLYRCAYAGISPLLLKVVKVTGVLQFDPEQSFYSFLLLLVFSLLLLRRRENTLKNALLSGLAIGASMMVRTPLFIFPPLVIGCDWLYGGQRGRAFLLRSLVFLAGCYVLLVPWGAVKASLGGKFELFDSVRAADNVITAAKGAVYTMEGNAVKLVSAGDNTGSSFHVYLREWLKTPLFLLLTVFRRLWHIFLYYPLLFGPFLLALAFSREKDCPLVFGLPVYFLGVHALLSIESRYLYPMFYLLPPLAAGTFLAGRPDKYPQWRGHAGKAAVWALLFSLGAVLAVEALLLSYPYRSARNPVTDDTFARLSRRFPRDLKFHEKYCRELWRSGDDAGFRQCLGDYSGKFGDQVSAYFLSALASRSPALLPLPPAALDGKARTRCLAIRMLREFELGDRAAARESYRQAYELFERFHNKLQGSWADSEPYKRDKELAALIRRDSDRFWEEFVYRFLPLWPPQSIAKILSGLKLDFTLTERLQLVEKTIAEARARGGDRQLRKWLVSGVLEQPFGPIGPWRDAAEKIKN
ncbi:MAG TPA: hypothetical protein PKI19_04890 [Elusimicrobiales bacterium]|nr:hypothetical protein [Elusimicrobiales bacterium]